MSLLQKIYPFTSLKEFFTFFYLFSESEDDLEFVVDSFNQISNLNINDVHLLLDKFQRLFDLKESSFSSYFLSLKSVVSKKMKILLPPVNKCLQCGKNLEISSNSNEITAFCFDSIKIMKQKSKYCSLCVIDYSFRNYTIGKTAASYLYPQEVLLSFLATSKPMLKSSEQLLYDKNCINPDLSPDNYEEAKLILQSGPQFDKLISTKKYRLAKLLLDDVYNYKIKECVDNQSIPLDKAVSLENKTKLLAAKQTLLQNIEAMEIQESGSTDGSSVTPPSSDDSLSGPPPSLYDGSSDGSSGPSSSDNSLSEEPPSSDNSLSGEPPSSDNSLSGPPSSDNSLSGGPPSSDNSISGPPGV
jgi:hypothetical protein